MVDRFQKGRFVNVLTICEYFSFELKDFFLQPVAVLSFSLGYGDAREGNVSFLGTIAIAFDVSFATSGHDGTLRGGVAGDGPNDGVERGNG